MSSLSDPPLASLDLLRQITDQHVVTQLLGADALTRAEIAQRTGISKPTISESMRRLEEAGLVDQAGQQAGRRGRAGTYFGLRADAGCALALAAGPEGLVGEVFDIRGQRQARLTRDVPVSVTAAELQPQLADLAEEAVAAAPGPVRASALSLAGPVDRQSGRLVHLPHAPFLVDELDAQTLLGGRLPELHVDNDINWAALAEAQLGNAADLDEFVYCYLGRGLGGAIVRDRRLVGGSTGLAGEIAQVWTTGPRGRAMRLVECFDAWGLMQPGTYAIDLPRVVDVLAGRRVADRRLRERIIDAVARALASVVALLDPAGLVIGGPWSTAPGLHERLAERLEERSAIPTTVRAARLGVDGPITGAGLDAVRRAQASVVGVRSNGG